MQPTGRRTFLALGLLLTGGVLTACTNTPHQDPGRPAGDHSRPDPDEPVRRRALDATDALLAAYDALLPQAPQLQPLREDVARHRAALGTGTPAPTPSTGTGTPGTGTSGATASTTAAAAPTTAAPTTASLASLERQTAQARLADLGAASPPLARLLASVSAAGVLHAVALGDAAPAAAAAPAPSASAAPPASGSPSASTTASGSASGSASADATAAPFQAALGAEHAAVYGYGVVGARLTDDGQRTAARTSLAAHQARRDAWQRLLAGAGATPDPAAAGYQLPFPVTDAASAGRLAAHLETRLTTVYADLVAAVATPQRPLAADALRESALRAHQWGAAPTAFPGITDTPAGTSTPTP